MSWIGSSPPVLLSLRGAQRRGNPEIPETPAPTDWIATARPSSSPRNDNLSLGARRSAHRPLAYLLLPFLVVLPSTFLSAQVTFEEKSEPAGLLATTNQTVSTGAEVETRTPALNVNGYAFTHWTINGTRHNDTNGQALNRVSLSLGSNAVAIAHYLDATIDSDADGIPDWHEIRELGTLDHDASHDGDGDGFGMAEELQYGLASTIKDEIAEGGVSIRRSGKLFMNFSGAKRITVSSDPAGLVSSSDAYQDLNSTFTSANLSGASNGYVFSHWEVNGVRRADAGGVGLNRITETLSEDKNVVAKYYPQDEDSDKDGMPDWYEWRQFGDLDKAGAEDPDGDGFTLAEEAKFGLSPTISDEITEGGVSIRRALQLNFTQASIDVNSTLDSDGDGLTNTQELALGLDPYKTDTDGDGFADGVEVSKGSNANDPSSFVNHAPTNLELNGTSVGENQPAGTVVGTFTVTDPDANSIHAITFADGNGSTHNHLFAIDVNGTLRTAAILDHKVSSALSLRVKATDEHYASFEKIFAISVVDVYEAPPPVDQNETVVHPPLDDNSTAPPSVDDGNHTGPVIDHNNTLTDDNQTHPVVEGNATAPPVVTQAYLPIVRTESIGQSTDDLLRFEGTVLTDGGSPILESGFLVGQSINLLPNVRLPAQPNASSNEFSASAQPGQFEPGKVYFFRAYARNALGESLGSIRQFRAPQPSDHWWEQIPAIGAGWRSSEWFGTFRPYDNGWIYHAKLGWAYAATDGNQGLWLWTEENGWLWTRPGTYPHLWKHRSGNWLYLLGTRDGKPVFFDFATNSVR